MASCSSSGQSDVNLEFELQPAKTNPNSYSNSEYVRASKINPSFSSVGEPPEYEGCGNVYAQPLPVPVVDPTAGNRKREGAEKWLKVAVVSLCAIAVILIILVVVLLSMTLSLSNETSDLKTRLYSVEEKLQQSNYSSMNEIREEIDRLKSNISDMRNQIEALDMTVGDLGTNSISLANQVESNSEHIVTINTQVSALEANVSHLNVNVSKNSKDLVSTNERIDAKETETDSKFDLINSDIGELQQNMSEVSENVDNLSGDAAALRNDLDSVSGKVDILESADFGSQIGDLETNVTLHGGELENIKDRLLDAESAIEQLEGITEADILADLGVANPDSYISDDGYVIIQQRVDSSVSFNKSMVEYENGFGSPGIGNNFWLGLETVYNLTSERQWKLKVEVRITGESEMKAVEFDSFSIGSKNEGYQFNLGAELTNEIGLNDLESIRGKRFSAGATDNSCSDKLSSGWWFPNSAFCGTSLNAPFCSGSFCAKIQSDKLVDMTKMMIKFY